MRVHAPLLMAWLVLALARPALAQAPELGLPLNCTPGDDCWVVRYVDVDDGPQARDFRCGERSGDEHQGVDFAVANLAIVERGAPVVAVAAGEVLRLRDEMDDVNVEETGVEAVAGLDCGNGLVMAHEGGWTTQYCHMRKGSLQVQPGDRVAAGDALGLVGLSGMTSFPHVHVTLRDADDVVIDPFTGNAIGAGCGPGTPLWRPEVLRALTYEPILLTQVGVAGEAPDWARIKAGDYERPRLDADGGALVLWADGYWLEEGDVLRFTIQDPGDETIFETDSVAERGRVQFFQFAGRRTPDGGFEPGDYRGEVAVERQGRPIASADVDFTLH